MKHMKPNIEALKIQISALLDRHPELADDENLRADMLEGSTDLHGMVERLLTEERQSGEMIKAIKERVDRLSERQSSFKNRQQSLRSVIMDLMQRADLRKLVLPEATVSITRRGPAVQIIDESLIPDTLCKIRKEPSKTAIKEALNAGVSVPGATLDNGSETLRIG